MDSVKILNGLEVNNKKRAVGLIAEALLTFLLSVSILLSAAKAAELEVSIYAFGAMLLVSLCCLLPGRLRLWLPAGAAALSAGSLIIPAVSEGAKCAINAVFAASESRNAYIYDMLETSGAETELCAFAVAFAAFIAAAAVLSSAGRDRVGCIVLFGLLALYEVYFGITPPGVYNLLAFCAAAALLTLRRSALGCAGTVAAFAVIAAIIMSVFPGTNAGIEELSESVRDSFDTAATDVVSLISPDKAEENRVKKENRLSEREGSGNTDTQSGEDIEKLTKTEREISRPNRVNYIRIILISLGILLMFVAPFAPFYLIDRRKKRAESMREGFNSESNAEAVSAMFTQIMRWLRVCGLYSDGELYSESADAAGASFGEEYKVDFIKALKLWQKAEYSGHPLTDEERESVKSMLEVTENKIYTKESTFGRFKLKYVYCLKV